MTDSNFSLSDIAAVAGNDNFGGGGFFWIFALLLLPLLSNGGLYGGNGATATKDDVYNAVQRSTDFAALERQNNEIMQNTSNVGASVVSAIKDGNYNSLGEIRDLQTAVNTGFANSQNCCCETNRNIDSVRFDMSNYAAQTQASIHAEGEQTRSMLQQNKIEALQSQINQLQLQNAVSGVVRYPSASTYSAGANPYCGCPTGF